MDVFTADLTKGCKSLMLVVDGLSHMLTAKYAWATVCSFLY